MNKAILTISVGAIVTFGFAVAQQRIHGSFKNGSYDGFLSFKFQKQAENYVFTGRGDPFVFVFKDQAMTVHGRTANGEMGVNGTNRYLKKLVAGGGVDATIEKKGQSTNVAGQSATFETGQSLNTITLTGGAKIHSTGPLPGEAINATGATGQAFLSPLLQGAGAVERATLDQNVHLERHSPPTADAKPYFVTADGDHLVIDNASTPRTITMTGSNVKIGGNDPTIGSTNEGITKAVLTLDDKGQVSSADFSGSPGVSVFHDSRPKRIATPKKRNRKKGGASNS